MRYDHFSMLPEKAFQPRNGRQGMTLEGGGSGGGGTSTTYTSNIPEWLRPQTEALLGAATQEYFNTSLNPETGKYDITGIKGYRPFSADKSSYFAPFTQQQRDVFGEVGGMTTSPLYGQAAGMTRQAGMGGMGTAQQALGYGQLGSGYGGLAAGMAPEAQMYGQTAADIGSMGLRAEELGRDVGAEARQFARQAAGMGGTYERMATDPMSVQGYMSPYMQQVVERQKVAAIEDAQRANLGQNLAAARQGTYGGARQALAQAQREAALEKQLGDIQAGGLQSAFEQAQRAQQFGVTTGLQGLQGAQAGLGTALQGGQLGLSGIGQAMAGQQAGLAGLQQAGQLYGLGMQGAGVGLSGLGAAQAGYGLSGQMGAQLGNIATAQQQADIQRLGLQREIGAEQQAREQGMINQAIQDYAMAQQYPFQQLAGYSGLLRGYATPTTTVSQYQAAQSPLTQFAGAGTSLAGLGQIVGMGKKEGGTVKSYAEGGITSVDALEGMAEDLSIPQLQQSIQNKTLPEYVGIPILQNKVNNAERMQMAQAGIAPDMGQEPPISDQVMAQADALQGIDSVPRAAGGGMVAFEKGGIARFQNQGIVLGEPEITQEMLEEERKRQQMFLGVDPRIAKTKEFLAKQGEEGFMDRALRGLQMIGAGEKIRTKGDFSELEKVNQAEMARRKAMAEREMKLAELEGTDYQQRAGIYKDVTGREREKARIAAEQKFKAGESEKDRQNRLAVASMPGETERIAAQIRKEAAANGEKISAEDAARRAKAALTAPPDRYNALSNRLNAANKDIGTRTFMLQEQLNAAKTDAERTKIKGQIDAIKSQVLQDYSITPADLAELQAMNRASTGGASTAPAAAPKPAAGQFSVTAPDGKTYSFPTQQAADEFKRRIQGQ